MRDGERQVAPTIDGIRKDHVERYKWACAVLGSPKRVLDIGCGVGYGSSILADAGHTVLAVDNDGEALAYQEQHYGRDRISRLECDAGSFSLPLGEPEYDAAVCFEMIEHLADPLPMLKALREHTDTLLASVPNERHFPHAGRIKFHHRHYTIPEFRALLNEAGWDVIDWFGQKGPHSPVCYGEEGRTAVAVARRRAAEPVLRFPKRASMKQANLTPVPITKVPETVAIIGLGPSMHDYVAVAKGNGARNKVADEIWSINALADVIKCDRVFHMDDVRIQEARAAKDPDGNIAAMLPWLKQHPGPIYTSRTHPDYPGLVEYPLEEVLAKTTAFPYFNSTAAYAVAYAIAIGVKTIKLYGMDFTYPDKHHAEKGRACVEYWLGVAHARGIKIGVALSSTLWDARSPADRLYGYDTIEPRITFDDDGKPHVSFMPREAVPTAEEIEDRYDHAKHPNSIVQGDEPLTAEVA